MSSREYNLFGRNDDDQDHQALYVKDASDDEEGRDEQAPYIKDASVLDEQPGVRR